jgi:hypothetical protein
MTVSLQEEASGAGDRHWKDVNFRKALLLWGPSTSAPGTSASWSEARPLPVVGHSPPVILRWPWRPQGLSKACFCATAL